MKNETIKVVLVEPGKEAQAAEYRNNLGTWQQLVGGYIELYYPFDDAVCILCNDEGKISGLSLNRAIRDSQGEITDIIAGTFAVIGLDNADDFRSLTAAELEKYIALFREPELFIGMNGKIIAAPYTA